MNRRQILVSTASITLLLLGALSCKFPRTTSSETAASEGSTRVGTASEEGMSPQFKEFREKFLGMRTAADVDAMLQKLNTDFDKYPDDLKFVAAQLIPLRSLGAVIARSKPLVEQTRVMHSMILSGLMFSGSALTLFLPAPGAPSAGSFATPAWEAIFHYFTDPSRTIGPDFKTFGDAQEWTASAVVGQLDEAIKRIEAIKIDAAKPIVWDNRIIFGSRSFIEDIDRFAVITETEQHLVLAGLHAMQHNALVFTAYNLELLPKFAESWGNIIGFDHVLEKGKVTGSSAKDRVEVICGVRSPANTCATEFKSLFVIRSGGKGSMEDAYTALKASVVETRKAWVSLKSQGETAFKDYQVLSPQRIIPWDRVNEHSLSNIEALVDGKPVRNAISGETFTINVPAFYRNPVTDMKSLWPIAFDPAPRMNGEARNYFYGKPIKWSAAAYGPYISGVSTGAEVATLMRNLSQSWGGWVANMPLIAMAIGI